MNPSKNPVDEIKTHIHDGNLSQRINLYDIFGTIQTVTDQPTSVPTGTSPYDQFKIYNGQLWYYDFLNNVWAHAVGGYFSVATNTNGTTNVNVFGVGGAPFPMTVTSVYLISKDTTAANITVIQDVNTVATIAKGTATGAMIGATSLAHTVYARGDICQVDSDSAGNATVIINFTV